MKHEVYFNGELVEVVEDGLPDPDPSVESIISSLPSKELIAILTLSQKMVYRAGDFWDALCAIEEENSSRAAIEIITDAALEAAIPLIETPLEP